MNDMNGDPVLPPMPARPSVSRGAAQVLQNIELLLDMLTRMQVQLGQHFAADPAAKMGAAFFEAAKQRMVQFHAELLQESSQRVVVATSFGPIRG